eukprot:4444153-Amphidinium_carterae.1
MPDDLHVPGTEFEDIQMFRKVCPLRVISEADSSRLSGKHVSAVLVDASGFGLVWGSLCSDLVVLISLDPDKRCMTGADH